MKKRVKSLFLCSLRLADNMFSFIFIALVVGYFKTASNCIIALHVTNGVKENKRTKKAEDLNFDSLTITTCKPNRRFNDSTI